MKAYVVRDGDYLARIAFRAGLDPTDVWDDPKNADLKALRKNPEILHPGDIIYLPDASPTELKINPGDTLEVEARPPTVTVELVLWMSDPENEKKNLLAGLAYTLLGGRDDVEEGTIAADGKVKFEVPVNLHEVTLVVEEEGLRFPVHIGAMDPATEPSGWKKRLAHLGYLDDDGLNETFDLSPAIRAFQRQHGLEPTGLVDDATQKALVEKHGS
jgi:N-acetylmuramoyl-L-alanine amidase